MGLLILKSRHSNTKHNVKKIEKQGITSKNNFLSTQICKLSFVEHDFKASFLYIRETPNTEELKEIIRLLENVDLVMGDINLDPQRTNDAPKLLSLCDNRSRVLNQTTTIRYNQLDHIFLNCEKYPSYYTTTFYNHSSDHYMISIRISKVKSNFNEMHLRNVMFNKEKLTTSIDNRKRKHGEKKTTGKVLPLQKTMNMNSLLSPNWLSDEIINNYLELLTKGSNELFAFSSFFFVSLQRGGLRRVKSWYSSQNITQYKKIFIPINYKENHWILCVFDGNNLTCYEPYMSIEGSKLKDKQRREYEKFLSRIRNEYLKPVFKLKTSIIIDIKMPPEIPKQNNGHDCGVFCLMFARYITLQKQFDFTTMDMLRFRDLIRLELQSNRIIFDCLDEETSNSKE